MMRVCTPRNAASALAALLLAAAAAPSALAQDDAARFQMERINEEEILRLDKQTGEVELCASSKPTFVCRSVVPASPVPQGDAEPASAELLSENQALRLENIELKRRLSMIAALVADTEPATDLAKTSSLLPPDARREIDEALDVTNYAVRRFQDLFKTLTEEPKTN